MFQDGKEMGTMFSDPRLMTECLSWIVQLEMGCSATISFKLPGGAIPSNRFPIIAAKDPALRVMYRDPYM